MHEISKYGYLRSTHIFDLLGDNRRSLSDRLTKMFRGHFINKPKGQRVRYEDNNNHHIYAVGNRGASILEQEFGIPKRSVYWNSKHDVGNQHIQHALLIADLLVALKRSCQTREGIELLEYSELFDSFSETTKESDNPMKLTVTVSIDGKNETLSGIPDSIFSLQVSDSSETDSVKNFFYEADRGTMPVRRVTLQRTAFYKKMIIYSEVQKQKLHTTKYNFSNVRVLTVTNTKTRMENLIAANQDLFDGKGSRMFLFTYEDALHGCSDALQLPWINGRGEEVVLVH